MSELLINSYVFLVKCDCFQETGPKSASKLKQNFTKWLKWDAHPELEPTPDFADHDHGLGPDFFPNARLEQYLTDIGIEKQVPQRENLDQKLSKRMC